jgi:chromosome segregation ATPase
MAPANQEFKTELALIQQNCKTQTQHINEKLDDIKTDLSTNNKQIMEMMRDHEKRLRAIENDKKTIAALVSSISAIIGVIGYMLYRVIKF